MSLGILNGNTLRRTRSIGALGASTIPSKCWDKPGFKGCHTEQWEQARDDCEATGAPDFGGNVGKCIEVMADAYTFNNCMKNYCPDVPLISQPVQVGPVFSSGDQCGSTNTKKFVQWVVGASPIDGNWGNISKAAYAKYEAATGKDWYDIAAGCVGEGPYPRDVVTAVPVVPTPVPVVPTLPELPVGPVKPGVSKASLALGVGIVSALTVGGYYLGKKQGWF